MSKYYSSSDDDSDYSRSKSYSRSYSRSDSDSEKNYEQSDSENNNDYVHSSSSSNSPKARKMRRKKEAPTIKRSRAKSGYQFFCDKERSKIYKEHPNWKLGKISQELGKRWRNADKRVRSFYNNKAKKART